MHARAHTHAHTHARAHARAHAHAHAHAPTHTRWTREAATMTDNQRIHVHACTHTITRAHTPTIFRLETVEKQDARKTFNKDWTARIMGIAVVGGFMGYIFLVTLQPPEQNSEALINLVLGYLGGLASAVISFYFGASNTGDKKDGE